MGDSGGEATGKTSKLCSRARLPWRGEAQSTGWVHGAIEVGDAMGNGEVNQALGLQGLERRWRERMGTGGGQSHQEWVAERKQPQSGKRGSDSSAAAAPLAPHVLGRGKCPAPSMGTAPPPVSQGLLPWQLKGCHGDDGDRMAGHTDQTPWPHQPWSVPTARPERPYGVIIQQHPLMQHYTPGEKTSPAIQHSTPNVWWPTPNTQGAFGSALVLPWP